MSTSLSLSAVRVIYTCDLCPLPLHPLIWQPSPSQNLAAQLLRFLGLMEPESRQTHLSNSGEKMVAGQTIMKVQTWVAFPMTPMSEVRAGNL